MTIQEALKTERPFRRRTWDSSTGWVIVDSYKVFAWEDLMDNAGHHADYIPTPEDVLASDWEIRHTTNLN